MQRSRALLVLRTAVLELCGMKARAGAVLLHPTALPTLGKTQVVRCRAVCAVSPGKRLQLAQQTGPTAPALEDYAAFHWGGTRRNWERAATRHARRRRGRCTVELKE